MVCTFSVQICWKFLAGSKNVLEIGCADAYGTIVFAQEVEKLRAIDFDPLFIEDVKAHMIDRWKFEYFVHDKLLGPVPGKYNGIYSLDKLKHIMPENETLFKKYG